MLVLLAGGMSAAVVHPPASLTPEMIWLGVFSLALDAVAVACPGGSFWSLSRPLNLLLVWLGQPAAALIALSAGLGLRWLVRAGPGQAGWREWLARAPGLMLATWGRAGLLAACAWELSLSAILWHGAVPGSGSEQRRQAWLARGWLWRHSLALYATLPLLISVASNHPAEMLWLLPFGGSLMRAVQNENVRLEAARTRLVQTRLDVSRQQVQKAQVGLAVIWELSRQLLGSQQKLDSARLCLQYLHSRMAAQAWAVVGLEQGQPVVLCADPPQLAPPLDRLEEGFRSGVPAFRQDEAILPLGEQGVLYCRQSGGYSDLERELLTNAAGVLSLSLRGCELYELQRLQAGRLGQASKLAAVGQLAAGVAHELNTPLAAIVLALNSALLHQDRPERVERSVQSALKASSAMQAIVSKLLFYARTSPGQRERVELGQVVQDCCELVGQSFLLANVELACQPMVSAPVLAIAGELQQVLVNLLVNAQKALAGQAAGRVEIGMTAEAGWAELRVSDNGPGVDPAVAERIFEPFFTTREVGQGTGLGLSIAREICQQHGGTLELLPSAAGACFSMRLPLLA
ncbi:MAG: ATP-binding protein [Vulcanimicrobiota bacterium]